MQECTIALPTGKSLEAPTLDLLRQAHIIVKRSPRSIEGTVEGFPRLSRALFCRPDQVATLVAQGAALCGITGKDVTIECPEPVIETCAELPYSRSTLDGTRCVLFTHRDNRVSTLDHIVRDTGGTGCFGRCEVASEYPAATRAFFEARGICLPIIPTTSAEVMVYKRIHRYGVALVETGTTLMVNGLKEIEDGTLFTSCTVLIANTRNLDADRGTGDSESCRARMGLLASLLKGTLEARSRVYLIMNAPVQKLREIERILPALKSPTVQQLIDPNFCSVAAVVPAPQVNRLILQLSMCGATGFATLPLSTVL